MLIVRAHRPVWRAFRALLLLGLVIVALGWLMERRYRQHIDMQDLQVAQGNVLDRQLQQQQTKNRYLLGRVNEKDARLRQLQQHLSMDATTIDELTAHIRSLKDTVYSLRRELEFYEGIIAAPEADKGLFIQGLLLESTEVANRWRLKLVLTHHVAKGDKVVKGKLGLTLYGKQDGVEHKLDLHELQLGSGLKRDIELRGFMRMEGSVMFPEAYVPEGILVQLQLEGKPRKRAERFFDWQEDRG